jgi:hypothetical protein
VLSRLGWISDTAEWKFQAAPDQGTQNSAKDKRRTPKDRTSSKKRRNAPGGADGLWEDLTPLMSLLTSSKNGVSTWQGKATPSDIYHCYKCASMTGGIAITSPTCPSPVKQRRPAIWRWVWDGKAICGLVVLDLDLRESVDIGFL